MTRRIILALASDTTETECGACPHIRKTLGMPRCEVFRRSLESGEIETFPPIPFVSRLPECTAAESKPLGRMVDREVERRASASGHWIGATQSHGQWRVECSRCHQQRPVCCAPSTGLVRGSNTPEYLQPSCAECCNHAANEEVVRQNKDTSC